jgi:hypothetical protein
MLLAVKLIIATNNFLIVVAKLTFGNTAAPQAKVVELPVAVAAPGAKLAELLVLTAESLTVLP